ncbi:MAG: hypothetical protein ACODAU_05610 [Myxococcota bacterium]
MRTAGRWLTVLAALVLPVSGVRAQEDPPPPAPGDLPEASTLETARGIGLGTGARASGVSTSAAAYNPANLGMVQLYHLESEVGFSPSLGGWWVGGTVVDSVSSPLAAGVSFRGAFNLGEEEYTGYDGRLALGYAISDAIALGVSGRFLKLRPDGQDEGVVDEGTKGFTMDAALRVTPTENLHIAALGYNLIDRHSALVPMMVGGSLSYAVADVVSIGGEGLVDLSTFDGAEVVAGGGVEYLAAGTVPLRLGYRFDSGRGLHAVTASVGYVDKHVGLDIALRQDVTESKNTHLLLTFRYHVQ